jgi:hypothetical protein
MEDESNIKPFSDIINKSKYELGYIFDTINLLNSLTDKLREVLDDYIASHCKVASFNNGILSIALDNSNWLTHIRYSTPNLISKLKKIKEFERIKSIKCFISIPIEY